MSELSFEQMLEESLKTIRTGEVVTGKVIDVKEDEVVLNIGYKSDGIIPRSEYTLSLIHIFSYMGASVLHEDAIFPVRREGIPINIRNTNKPDDKGTLIVESTCRKPKYIITGICLLYTSRCV